MGSGHSSTQKTVGEFEVEVIIQRERLQRQRIVAAYLLHLRTLGVDSEQPANPTHASNGGKKANGQTSHDNTNSDPSGEMPSALFSAHCASPLLISSPESIALHHSLKTPPHSTESVGQHTGISAQLSLRIIIHGAICDVTAWQASHPGGSKSLQKHALTWPTFVPYKCESNDNTGATSHAAASNGKNGDGSGDIIFSLTSMRRWVIDNKDVEASVSTAGECGAAFDMSHSALTREGYKKHIVARTVFLFFAFALDILDSCVEHLADEEPSSLPEKTPRGAGSHTNDADAPSPANVLFQNSKTASSKADEDIADRYRLFPGSCVAGGLAFSPTRLPVSPATLCIVTAKETQTPDVVLLKFSFSPSRSEDESAPSNPTAAFLKDGESYTLPLICGGHVYIEAPDVDPSINSTAATISNTSPPERAPTSNGNSGSPRGGEASKVSSSKTSFIRRPYTPVRVYPGGFDLIVKRYASGVGSSYLHSLAVGDSVRVAGPAEPAFMLPELLLQLPAQKTAVSILNGKQREDSSPPELQTSLNATRKPRQDSDGCRSTELLLVAGGTGAAPIYSVANAVVLQEVARVRALQRQADRENAAQAYDQEEPISTQPESGSLLVPPASHRSLFGSQNSAMSVDPSEGNLPSSDPAIATTFSTFQRLSIVLCFSTESDMLLLPQILGLIGSLAQMEIDQHESIQTSRDRQLSGSDRQGTDASTVMAISITVVISRPVAATVDRSRTMILDSIKQKTGSAQDVQNWSLFADKCRIEHGRISDAVLQRTLRGDGGGGEVTAAVCGPPPFNAAVRSCLLRLDVESITLFD